MSPVRLRKSERAVFDALRLLADREGGACTRRQDYVGVVAGRISRASVERAYAVLTSLRLIDRTSQPIGGGGRSPDRITVPLAHVGGLNEGFERPEMRGSLLSPCCTNPILRPVGRTLPITAGSPEPAEYIRRPDTMRGRTPTQNDLDWVLYCRLYRECRGHARAVQTNEHVLENRRHLKTLRARLGAAGLALEPFLRAFLSQDDDWLADRAYALRYACRQEAYLRLVDALQAEEADPGPTPILSAEAALAVTEAAREAFDVQAAQNAAAKAEQVAEHNRALAARDARLVNPTHIEPATLAKLRARGLLS